MYRTHTCGQLGKKEIGKEVKLAGWVHRRRDHGGLIFIDLRDRYGLTQVAFDPKINKKAWGIADKVRPEYVIQAQGKVKARPKDMVNKKLQTGEIELEAYTINILNEAKTTPFEIVTDEAEAEKVEKINEELRMKYRYLDLRQQRIKQNVIFRHKFIKFIRDFLDKEGFLEIETPILTKSTPEGARDYLVPSRVQPGKFYALPQSPQQYKQLLMVAGVDKYFQIARCFRDEDQRGDRTAEFTQLDLEMSFVEQKDILDLTEKLFTEAIEKLTNKKIQEKPWPRLKYQDVMLKYGIDRPDLRFGLEIEDVTEILQDCSFKIFAQAIKQGGVVRALRVPKEKIGREKIDRLEEKVKAEGAKGLAYIIIEGKDKYKSPVAKHLGNDLTEKVVQELGGEVGDTIFLVADKRLIAAKAMGELRLSLGHSLNLIKPDVIALAYVVDFPLFKEEIEDVASGFKYDPSHHIFTAPKDKDIPLLSTDPLKARCWQHDLVANGYEVGGGSIRIHDREIQEKIFELVGLSKKEIKQKFGHILEAFEYGAPPHGGIAPGLDRMLMVIQDEPNIREVMAFPKTGDAKDLVMGAPSEVKEEQLKDLSITINK